jgi:hypothetical protein
MDKKEATRELYKMYRVLKDASVKVAINRKIEAFGCISWDDGGDTAVDLNPNKAVKGGIISTAIHELLHYTHYDWPEWMVNKKENEIYDNLSDKQLSNLIKKVAMRMKK